jgi:hypothetical protein
MQSRLYVGNLSDDVRAESSRRGFAESGGTIADPGMTQDGAS